ncbi:DegT/DnrJ/EryC1/StrS aminotransferase, partial [Streptomyces sp. BG9H]|nr:DegT/DnrJ/EryC1/StrS aminotransferase [Streptomyces anatolicus]
MQIRHLHRLLAAEPALRHTAFDGTGDRVARVRHLRAVVERLARVERAPLAVTDARTSVRDGLHREHMTLDSPVRGSFHGTLLAPPA